VISLAPVADDHDAHGVIASPTTTVTGTTTARCNPSTDASSGFATAETTTDGHVRFAFIPCYLFWSLLIITLDIFIIWALAAHGGQLREPN
jgi:hypothetical protein